jgi:hypothetical protein
MGEIMRNLPEDVEKNTGRQSVDSQQAAKAKKFEALQPSIREAHEVETEKPMTPHQSTGEIIKEAQQTPDTFEGALQEIIEKDPVARAERKRFEQSIKQEEEARQSAQRKQKARERKLKREAEQRDFEQREREAAELLGETGLEKIRQDLLTSERQERLEGYKKEARRTIERQKAAGAAKRQKRVEGYKEEARLAILEDRKRKRAQERKLREAEQKDFEQREREAAELLGETGLEKIRQEIESQESENVESEQQEEQVIISPDYQREIAEATAERAARGLRQYEQLKLADRFEDLAAASQQFRDVLASVYGIPDADEYARNLSTSTWAKAKHLARMLRPGFRSTWNKFVQADEEYNALLRAEKLPGA